MINQDETDNLPVGISDFAKQNSAYRNLIELANISKYSNEEILEEWMRKDLKILTWRNSSLLLTADRPSSEQEYSPTDRQILNYNFINKFSLKSIASLMNWAVEDVKKTIDNFYKLLKDSKSEEEWKQELKKKEKIDKDTQDIKDYVKQNSGKILTILSIKSYFDSARQEDDKIALYRIRKTMKVEMGYTFKKASIINKVMILSDRKRNFSRVQWYSCTYMKLLKKSYILMMQVVLKEIRKFYTWSKKGKKTYIVSHFDNLTLSMWFAFSKLRFYGVMATSNTFNSTKFLLFLKQLIYQRQTYHKDLSSNFALICDNS